MARPLTVWESPEGLGRAEAAVSGLSSGSDLNLVLRGSPQVTQNHLITVALLVTAPVLVRSALLLHTQQSQQTDLFHQEYGTH